MTPSPALLEAPDQRKETVMLKNKFALAAVAAASVLAATPALADGYRSYRPQERAVVVHEQYPHYAQRRVYMERPVTVHRPVYVQRPVYVERPVYVRPQPVVVYSDHGPHDVLGGLIVGAMIGAVIASNAAAY
jgi:hypothetical protein